MRSARGVRRRARSRTGRCSATGPDEFPGRAVFEALGRGQEVSPEHVFAYAALRPAERRDDGWWLTGRPDPDRDAEEARASRRRVRRHRDRRPDLLALPRLAGRGDSASGRRSRRARDGHRRLLPRPSSRPSAAAARARGGAHGPRGGGVDTRGDAPPGRRAVQRDHAEVVGQTADRPDVRAASWAARDLRGELGVPARPRPSGRTRAAERAGDGRSRPQTCAAACGSHTSGSMPAIRSSSAT